MRWSALIRIVAVLAAVAVAAIVALSIGGDDGRDDGPTPGEPVAATTSVTEAPPPPTATSTSSTATTAPPATTSTTTTTTTAPPTTTTTTATVVAASDGYGSVPKPAAGRQTVAPGGALTKHLAADIATAFGFETADVEAAIAAVQLPPEAGGNPEGWLAPGSYEFAEPGDVVQAMVDRRVAQLEARSVPRVQWQRVLTAASVIEKETYNQSEKPGVARVLLNRLAGGGPLQMDSIILYPAPEDRIFTTAEERSANQPYNSYRQNGLPPTPIAAADEASIDAFLAPPPGDWWFYVTVDLDTGETRYAVTFEEHQSNVELLRAWLADNPTP